VYPHIFVRLRSRLHSGGSQRSCMGRRQAPHSNIHAYTYLMYIYLSIYLPIYPSVCISIHICICVRSRWCYGGSQRSYRGWRQALQGIYIYIYISKYICIYIYIDTHTYICMYIYIYIYLSIDLSIYLYVCLCIYPFLYLYIFVWLRSGGSSGLG